MDGGLKVEELIMLIIDHSKEGVKGKTLLQKRAYFVSILTGKDLGFRAHYYGPFSGIIESGINRVKELGFVEENLKGFGSQDKIGFEVRRYDYRATKDGEVVIERLKKNNPKDVAEIYMYLDQLRNAGDDGDYIKLSVAAKTYFILDKEEVAMRQEEIRSTAKGLGWNIIGDSINKAGDFLEKLGLVE